MKSLIGQHIKSLQGDTRHIAINGDEALIIEKQKGMISIHICVLEGLRIQTHYSFHSIPQSHIYRFLLGAHKKRDLAKGIRIGPMFKQGQTRRIVILRKPKDGTYFVKIEPVTADDAVWTHNNSGWVPMTNLSQKAPGMVVFVQDVQEEDLVEIGDRYTKDGIFFLREHFEVYVENVKLRYAFGKLVPRNEY